MDDKNKALHNGHSPDNIPAGTHVIKDHHDKPSAQTSGKESLTTDEIVRQAEAALNMEIGKTDKQPVEDKRSKKKKKHFSFFGRKNKYYEDQDDEDDLYYGLQLKPLSEYRNDYDQNLKSDSDKADDDNPKSNFSYPFEQDNEESQKDIEETFERIHQERRERLEKIMQQAGMEPEDFLKHDDSYTFENKPDRESPPQPPRVEPEPLKEPEVKPPLTEPVYEPSKTPEISDEAEPDKISQDSDETEDFFSSYDKVDEAAVQKAEEQTPPAPIREPALPPREKDNAPVPPAVKEPETIPRPQYRAVDHIPLHVIKLDNFENVLKAEAKSYPAPVNLLHQEPINFPPKKEEAVWDEVKPSVPTKAVPTDSENTDEPADEPPVKDPQPDETTSAFTSNTIELPLNFKPKSEYEKPKKRFRLFGTEELDNIPDEELPCEEEELDDYTKPTDAPSILNEISSNVSKLFVRLAATGILTLILFIFSMAYEHPAFLPPEIHSFYTAQVCLIINLIFLFIASAFCFPAIINGLKGLFKFQANSDSACAAATVAALIQSIVLLFSGLPSGIYLYPVLAATALFLNTSGKLSMEKRIFKNFRYISSPGQKYAVHIFDDYNTALNLTKGCVIGDPQIAYQTKAKFLKNFLRLSYATDPSEHTSQIMATVGFIASLILCVICSILTKSVTYAVTAFTAAVCVCVPFTNMLSVNLPLTRLNHIAERSGAMISGWSAVEHFSETNAVMLDTKDLFPRGTVILNGIKTFAGQRIDDAILDATALMCTVGGPLSDLFDQIIKSRRDILPKVSSASYQDKEGVTGIVNGRKIFVGNRELMKANGIEPPSRDYEEKYISVGKSIVYLASNTSLVAMFIISYSSDRHRAMELKRIESNGISLVVRTCDPNITPAFLSTCFGINATSVYVLPEQFGEIYTELQSSPPDRADALMATNGRLTVMLRLLTGCIRQRSNISIAVALQNTGVALGFALVAFFACYSGLKQLSATALLIFEAFWAAMVIFIPRLRRP